MEKFVWLLIFFLANVKALLLIGLINVSLVCTKCVLLFSVKFPLGDRIYFCTNHFWLKKRGLFFLVLLAKITNGRKKGFRRQICAFGGHDKTFPKLRTHQAFDMVSKKTCQEPGVCVHPLVFTLQKKGSSFSIVYWSTTYS